MNPLIFSKTSIKSIKAEECLFYLWRIHYSIQKSLWEIYNVVVKNLIPNSFVRVGAKSFSKYFFRVLKCFYEIWKFFTVPPDVVHLKRQNGSLFTQMAVFFKRWLRIEKKCEYLGVFKNQREKCVVHAEEMLHLLCNLCGFFPTLCTCFMRKIHHALRAQKKNGTKKMLWEKVG